jgi:hypothetical protein
MRFRDVRAVRVVLWPRACLPSKPKTFWIIAPDTRGLLACDQLGLAFGVHDGQLRFFTPDGALVATPEESALAAQRAAARAEQRAAHAEAELAELRAKLKP